jgi:alpha-beta hydrolase superfamily lysophospholipase
MVGSDDSLGGEKSALKLLNAYSTRSGLVDASLVVYDGARHEIFNELNQEEVRADLIRWLDERFAVD